MRRFLPLLILLAGCGKGDPIADKIDLSLPPGTSITSSNESIKEGDRRFEILGRTDTHAKDIGAFYKARGFDAVVQGETANIMGKTPKGQMVIIDVSPIEEVRQIKIVAIQPKDAPR